MRRAILLILAVVAVGSPSLARSSTDPADTIQVTLDGGTGFTAVEARPAGQDMVAFGLLDGTLRYVPAARIRTIRGANGRDWTGWVVDQRKTLSAALLRENGSGGSAGRPPQQRSPAALTFRGHPYPITRSFLITEFGLMRRMDGYPYPAGSGRLAVSFDLGWMKNIGTRHAVGLTGYVLSSDPTTRFGIRARYRRWLSPGFSIDLSPGVLLSGEDAAIEYQPVGLVLGATLNAGDLVAVMVDTEYARNWRFAETDPPFVNRVVYHDFTWRAGAKLGSGLGVLGAAALVGLFLYIGLSGGFD